MLLKISLNDKNLNKLISVGELSQKDKYNIFEYIEDIKDKKYMVALRMPINQKIYINEFQLLPFFDMFIPEGYLFNIFRQILIKNYNIDHKNNDFHILNILAPNIEGRVEFFDKNTKKSKIEPIELDYIKENDTFDTFTYLLKTFLNKNAIGGVQPKTLVDIIDKTSLSIKEYIIKTWGNEYPYLVENEYFCMQAIKKAGIITPEIDMSKNKKFLIVKKFIDKYTGFEEVLGIFGLNREAKYNGSYERIAKLFQILLSNPEKDLKTFYKLIVMNYLLGNGDAHLKNFGVLYDFDMSNIRLSPAYDVICTIAYIQKDKPALTLEGRKIWHNKKTLINFGTQYCMLDITSAKSIMEECENAICEIIEDVKRYIKENSHFKEIGKRMILFWENYLKKNDTI